MKQKLCVMAAAVAALAAGASAADYRTEAAQIAAEIIEIHPRGGEILASEDFQQARAALMETAGDASLPAYAMALGRVFHAANDGHTAVIPFYGEAPEFTHRYPLRIQRFEDGLYVVAAKGAAAPLLGGRVTQIGGRDINEVLRALVGVMAAGNRAWPANWMATALTRPGYLEGLGVAPNALTEPAMFTVVRKNGRRLSADLVPAEDGAAELTDIGRKETMIETLGRSEENYAVELDDGAALYIRIGQMQDEEDRSFKDFSIATAAAIEATGADRLIIDLRENGGGNNMLAEPLRRIIVRSRFNRPGGIFVLTAPQTFSAAMNFASRLERETDALFVGEPTGGSPNHFGDAKFAVGEISGLPYIISTLRWQDMPPFDERPWILPDLPAPLRYDDFLEGRDLALDRALGGEPDVAPMTDAWGRRVAEPWARASQQSGWRFFYEKLE